MEQGYVHWQLHKWLQKNVEFICEKSAIQNECSLLDKRTAMSREFNIKFTFRLEAVT